MRLKKVLISSRESEMEKLLKYTKMILLLAMFSSLKVEISYLQTVLPSPLRKLLLMKALLQERPLKSSRLLLTNANLEEVISLPVPS
jgi:hypothetical protein